jgi:Na+/H+-dicarboxylate symporter
MATNNILQILVFSLFAGVALVRDRRKGRAWCAGPMRWPK